MDVTDVLRGRISTGGLQKMISVSIAAHLVVAAALIVSRGDFCGATMSRRR